MVDFPFYACAVAVVNKPVLLISMNSTGPTTDPVFRVDMAIHWVMGKKNGKRVDLWCLTKIPLQLCVLLVYFCYV
jgi:hypothetical protein